MNQEQSARQPDQQASIIELDLDLSIIVEASSILGRRFTACCSLHRLEPWPCPGVTLQGAEIVDRYNRLQNNRCWRLPPARLDAVRWVSPTGSRMIPTIRISNRQQSEFQGLGLAVQIQHDGHRSVFVPVVVFDAACVEGGSDVLEHNGIVLQSVKTIRGHRLRNAWLAWICHALFGCVRDLITAALSPRASGIGGTT